jgi:hypothetical protein
MKSQTGPEQPGRFVPDEISVNNPLKKQPTT